MSDPISRPDFPRPLPPWSEDSPFTRLAGFQIIERIGRGDVGHVYKAYEKPLQRHVAVKVLLPEFAREATLVRRFETGATSAARVTHPNVVPIYSIGEDSGRHFFVMQWVEGESLAERLSERRRLSPNEAIEILKQCLAGLGAAHSRNVIHGGLKPGNILLEDVTGRAMLVDFGMVHVTAATSAGVGTEPESPASPYAAPELVRGGEVGRVADLYSLGVTAYEMLAGCLPSPADAADGSETGHEGQGPLPLEDAAPGVSAALGTLVARMMAPRPEDRYQRAEEVLAHLQTLQDGKSAAATGSARPAILDSRPHDSWAVAELSPGTADALRPGWRQALRDRAWSLFRAKAPRLAQELANTEQRVDGAVAEYGRRYEELGRLVEEAERIAGQLASRQESFVQAAADAAQRVASTEDQAELKQARQSLESSRQDSAELAEQQRQLEEQLNDLHVEKAQIHAKLLELTSRRDLLRARLQAARARIGPRGRRTRRAPVGLLIAAGLIVVLTAAMYPARLWYAGRNGANNPTAAPAPPEIPSPVAERDAAATPTAASTPEIASPAAAVTPEPQEVSLSAASSGEELTTASRVTAADRRPAAALDLSIYPVSTIRTFDGPPPPYVLRFSGKQSVHFEMPEIGWDWLSRSFVAALAVRMQNNGRPCRLMGNLDTRPSDSPKPGWAILCVPAEDASSAAGAGGAAGGELAPARSQGAKKARLAFVYSKEDGGLGRLVGPPFEPGDRWWRISVSQPWNTQRIAIHLGETRYLEGFPEGMIRLPCPTHFWLGCPDFADEGFRGDIGGFALHRQEYPSAPRFSLGSPTKALFSFSHAPNGQVFDFSGTGSHGELLGCKWVRLPERPLPAEPQSRPPEGKTFAVSLGKKGVIELLGTRGLAALGGTFTVEMWVWGLEPGSGHVLVGNWLETFEGSPALHYAGWSLGLAGPHYRSFAFSIVYPLNPGHRGYLETPDCGQFQGDAWHHVAFCNTPDRRQVYLDGKPLLSDETELSKEILDHLAPSRANLSIGVRRSGSVTTLEQIRAFRLSSCRRYQEAFVPPSEFAKDEHTLVLLDFSRRSSSPFIDDVSGGGHHGLMVLGSWVEVDEPLAAASP